MKNLLLKLKESAQSVAPVALTVIVLGWAVCDFTAETLLQFTVGAILLILGMALFNMGADISMAEAGNLIGADIIKTKKSWLVIGICFLLGVLIIVAEPSLMVLAGLLPDTINNYALIIFVGVGVGVFLTLAILRIIFKIPYRILMIVSYSVILILGIFVPAEFFPLALDSGGVATGPITVPFIMAFGIGVAATKKGSEMDDNFGIVSLCAVGPMIAVMIMGIIAGGAAMPSDAYDIPALQPGIIMPYLRAMPEYMGQVAIALSPVMAFILIYNFARLRLSKSSLLKFAIGFVIVFAGLVLFLTGVNVGFAPAGMALGATVTLKYKWVMLPVAVLIGFFTVVAEPSVHVLMNQMGEISGGTIKKGRVLVFIMTGVAGALGLAMIRVLTGISIWYIVVPGYLIAMALTFFSPKIFTAIAFDSGAVASGPMSATFILPLTIGATLAAGGNVVTDAFGVIALITMTPFIAIQILGIISGRKAGPAPVVADDDDGIIDFDNPETTETEAQISDNKAKNGKKIDIAEVIGTINKTAAKPVAKIKKEKETRHER